MSNSTQPVGNGLRTDHPVPNLPFVDDGVLPVDDPEAIEAIGRNKGGGMWGRCDDDPDTGEWAAFTTDPVNKAFGWVVRFHPRHGRSILLYRAEDVASAYDEWYGDRALLTRHGGYWWDGETWYRPRQVFDYATERYVRRPARSAVTISAADLLDATRDPGLGQVSALDQAGSELPAVTARQWGHDLALWNKHRSARPGALPAEQCVVGLNAPELSDAALLGVDEFAQAAGLAASTLRAYIARDEADIPAPQRVEGNRRRWARTVVADWLEERDRDPYAAQTALTGDKDDTIAPGVKELWKRLSRLAFSRLWGPPALQRLWARAHRNEESVRKVADEIGWVAALTLNKAVPFEELTQVIEAALLHHLSRYRDNRRPLIGLPISVGKVLGWFVRHQPTRVPALLGALQREAQDQFDITPERLKEALRTSLEMDGGFSDSEQLEQFLSLAFPPER